MDKTKIAKKLKDLRGTMNREDVAAKLEISVSALQMYENGQRIPRDEIKVRIANFYDSTVQDIFFNISNHEMCPDSESQEVI